MANALITCLGDWLEAILHIIYKLSGIGEREQIMILFLLSVFILLAIVGGAVAILGKERSRRLKLSEAWKLFFALILFGLSSGLNARQNSSLAAAKIGMFIFACMLTIWFIISIVRHRRNAKA